MKTISVALKAHLAQQFQTLARCWKVTLVSGAVKAFTDHDRDLVFSGVTYLASSGYVASSVQTTASLGVDSMEVSGMLVSPSITEADLTAGLWDFAAYEIFMVNWADLTMGRTILRVGNLGEVSIDRSEFRAELFGLTKAYGRVVGQLTSPHCRASLGDARCQVNLVPFTVAGTLTDVLADNTTLFDSSRAELGPLEFSTLFNIQQHSPTLVSIVTDVRLPTVSSGSAVAVYGVGVGNEDLRGIFIARLVQDSTIRVAAVTTIPGAQPSPAGYLAALGDSSGYFDFGVITFTSGNNIGRSMEVKHYVPGMMVLQLPLPYAAAIGDTYEMVAGCDKKITTCISKFNNVVNNRSEPHVPGMDQAIQVGRRG